jgi:hypothetical protein
VTDAEAFAKCNPAGHEPPPDSCSADTNLWLATAPTEAQARGGLAAAEIGIRAGPILHSEEGRPGCLLARARSTQA